VVLQASNETYSEPEGDGTQELTLYVDRENYIPIGVVVKGKVDPATGNRELLGEYFFPRSPLES